MYAPGTPARRIIGNLDQSLAARAASARKRSVRCIRLSQSAVSEHEQGTAGAVGLWDAPRGCIIEISEMATRSRTHAHTNHPPHPPDRGRQGQTRDPPDLAARRPAGPRGRGDHRVRAHAAGAGGPALVHGGLPAGDRSGARGRGRAGRGLHAGAGEELYTKVLAANLDTQAIWFAVREQLADLRVEITTGIAEAAAIPWELMRDPQSDSPIALRVRAFVRVQSNPNLSFVPVPPAAEGRIRLLYVVCRPGGTGDVALRAVANRLLQDLGADLARFEITALRPPTFEQLQRALTDAKAAGRPYHIVHFDGHGIYEDLSNTVLADWLKAMSVLTLGGTRTGKHGYLLFEHPGSDANMRPVSGDELGKLLHDTGVPVLVLNACQSAMHEAQRRRRRSRRRPPTSTTRCGPSARWPRP